MTGPWANFLILDDEAAHAKKIEQHLIKMFLDTKLTIKTQIISDRSKAKEHLEKHPDFFICDVHLTSGRNAVGLQVIENLKPKFPHINFLAITMEFEELKELSTTVVQPDIILSKLNVLSAGSTEFDRYLLGYFIANRRQNRRLAIKRDTSVEAACKRALGWTYFHGELFDCLVRQVFKPFDLQLDAAQFWRRESSKDSPKEAARDMRPQDVDLGEIVDVVKIKKLEIQGRSGSAVFKAEPIYEGKPYQVTVILKFCPIKVFLKEISNFSRYVKWMLPYSWRVDVLGEGISENVGVIGYSLAFAGAADAKPLSAYSIAADPRPILGFVEQVFSPESRTWYAAIKIATGQQLANDLWQRYFLGPDKLNRHLGSLRDNLAASHLFAEIYGNHIDILEAFIGRVRKLTIGSSALENYETCICHGDLHCDNIMVGERKTGPDDIDWSFAFIDFQDTGPAHIGTDFVIFENSIRKDSGFEIGMSELEYYRIEKNLILNMLGGEKPKPQKDTTVDYIDIIQNTRAAFFSNFSEANAEHFVFHLFVFTLFMTDDKFRDLPRKNILLAFFCAVVDALTEFRAERSNGNDSKRPRA